MITVETLQAVVASDVKVGITTTEPLEDAGAAIRERVAAGLHGGLGFTYRDPETASSPASSFPWASSIVVAAVPYLIDGDGVDAGSDRRVARFATGDRYDRVRRTIEILAETLERHGYRTEGVYDDDRLVDRAVAVRAGVAWSGKSTMAITPGAGPWFLIGSVVTDAAITPSTAMVRGCGTCSACIPACPTGAIIAPGMLDAARCLAAVLQRPGSIPEEFREAVGGRVYGCDDCLVACPPGDQALAAVSRGEPTPHPRELLGMSDVQLEAHAAHWYVPKRNMRYVRRNALVALGNNVTGEDVGILSGYLGHPDGLLRSHAAWALGMLATEEALAALAGATVDEDNQAVRDEIEMALARTTALDVGFTESLRSTVYAPTGTVIEDVVERGEGSR
jgi:epoxyqueuosine reductase